MVIMGIVFRQSIKTTIVTFLGALLGALIVYMSSKLLPQQLYGFSQYLLRQAIVGSQIVLLGTPSVIYIYINKYPPEDRRRTGLITLCLLLPVLTTLLFSAGYLMFEDPIVRSFQPQDRALLDRYFLWLPPYVLLWSMIMLLEQYLYSQMKVAISTFTREVVLRLFNIALVLLFYFGQIGFHLFIISSILVHVVPVAMLSVLAWKTEGFRISLPHIRSFSRDEYKDIIGFALFHVLINVSVHLLNSIDLLMLGALSRNGVSTLVIYTQAITIMSIVYIPYRAMANAASPMLNQAYHDNDMDKVRELYNRAGINTLIAAVLMLALIGCNLHNIVAALGERFSGLSLLALILMIGKFIDMSSGISTELLAVSRYYRYNFYFTVFLVLLNIVFNYFFIPRYGIYGAAWSSTISLSLFNIIKFIFLKQKMQIQPFSRSSYVVLLCGVVIGSVGYALPYMVHPFLDAIVRSAAIVLIYMVLLFWLKPSADLATYIQTVIKNKRLF